MKRARWLVGVLLVLVMLGSVVSPALALSTGGGMATCPSCLKVTTGKSKVAVIEVTGIEKNEILAKALKNEDVKRLAEVLVKNGHRQELAQAEVVRVVSKFGEATVVKIPFKGKNGLQSEVVTVISSEGVENYAWEAYISKNGVAVKVYYVNANGKLVTVKSSSDFGGCLYECVGGRQGIASCIGSCAGCIAAAETGNIWAIIASCVPCAVCLDTTACCVGKCASEESWGSGFCSAMYIQCILGGPVGPVACAIYDGCDGNCL